MTAYSPLVVRPQTRADRPAVAALVAAAFGQPDEARLVERLQADGDAAISLVAADAAGVCGHILFSNLSTTAALTALALAPLAVAPGRQGRGVGSALVRAGLEAARALPRSAVFVLGDPGYYARFGFSAAAAEGFQSPYAGPHFMGLFLTDDSSMGAGDARSGRAGSRGVLTHAAAFSGL